MAEVFKAKIYGAEGFERLIAIKRILPHLIEDDDFVHMFVDEAKIAVRLSHPNIVGIDDLGKAEGTLFIAMEFVQGKDLRAIYDVEKARGSITPIGISCHIIMKMCEALHHAHFATGPGGEPLHVIHRDVSPQNVLLSFDGEVKVADFGLAKARGRIVQTQAGVVKGKLAYMSPEQLRGEEIDHRVDVFGLGIVLYELLTGMRLFLGQTDMDTLKRVYDAQVPPLQHMNPRIHPDLEAIARKALAKDRDERFSTALDLFEALEAHVYAQGIYAGTSALRRYVHEAFPEVAPALDVLPPFAPSAPSPPPPPPIPTKAPPSRAAIRPPPDPLSDPSLSAVSLVDPGLVVSLDPPIATEENRPTDTPPSAVSEEDADDAGLSPLPPIATQRVELSPESSAIQRADSASSMPSEPPGLYDEAATYDSGPDTSPAPALDTDDHGHWDDTTEFEPTPQTVASRAQGFDEWDDEQTQVVDPHAIKESKG